jgi:hypothetical protein
MSTSVGRKFTTHGPRQKELDRIAGRAHPADPPGRQFRRPGRVVLLALLLVCVPGSWGTVSATPCAQAPHRIAPLTLTWLEEFLEMLKLIYGLLGGIPTDLDEATDAESAMSMVSSYWNSHGLPSGLTNAQRLALIADINNASTHLNSAPGSVSSTAIQSFRSTLSAIRSAAVIPDGP